MARPKKADDDRRTESTRADLSVSEKLELAEKVRVSGCRSEAEFIRRAIASAVIQAPHRSASDPALVVALNRIGNNVNQLALSVHRGSDFQRYWHEIGEELRDVLHTALEGIRE